MEGLSRVRERIAAACARAGRPADSVRLIAVSKTQPLEKLRAAVQAGQRLFGENYAQELREKADALGPGVTWHFIGALPEDVPALVDQLRALARLRCDGLMCIPPAAGDPRPHFAALRELAARLGLSELSMGMSADFETAIEEGATLVRVGTAIFGERP